MLTYGSQMTPFNDIHLCRRYSVSCLPHVRSTCHWLVIMSHHLSQLWNMKQNAASHGGAEDSNQSWVMQVRNPSRGQRCDITSMQLIFCSFILQRSFVVKKLGNTKIDSWIVMPIMTI